MVCLSPRATGGACALALSLFAFACGPSGSGPPPGDDTDGSVPPSDGAPPPDTMPPDLPPYDDFPEEPILDGTATPGAPDAFGDPMSGDDDGGPCLVEPELGALIPQDWIRLRVRFLPVGRQNLFEIRIKLRDQNHDLRVYTSNKTWTMPKAMWEGVVRHSRGAPLEISVRGGVWNGSGLGVPPALGSHGNVTIAPSYAQGVIVYWTTSGGTALKGFHIGDETVQEVLRPAGAQTSCVGCHTATPDGKFAGFTAAGADPDDDTMFVGLRSVDGSLTQPPYLSTAGRSLLARTWQMAPAFSRSHFRDGDRIALSMYMGNSIIWTDLEANSATGSGVIDRGADNVRFPAMVNWSHDGTKIAYCSTVNAVISGVQTSDCDIYTVPYNDRAGGNASPLSGASETAWGEYYPAFSPDDKLIAFNRLPPGEDTYGNALAELFVIPATGGTPVRLAANDPPACTGKDSPGLTNSWPKWSPGIAARDGKTYYWVTFSSTRVRADTPQIYVSAIVVDGSGHIETYPSLYVWNQPAGEGNHTPAWESFLLPDPP